MKDNEKPLVAHWNKELALLWTKNLPPCRPSWSEMAIYTKYLRITQSQSPHHKVKLLILGSSAEFRDWAHQENIDTTIIDCSKEYHDTIEREMKHKCCEEKLVIQLWQDMSFKNEFDLIVGDLVVGNLYPEEIPPFLQRISKALKEGGFFMTKSFFRDENKPIKSYKQILLDYYKNGITYHPYPQLIYDIAMCCVDKKTGLLNFNHMYKETLKMYKSGIMKKETFEKFKHLGWEKEMKFLFYIPTFRQWENWIAEYLKIYTKEYGIDLYSKNFPIYIITTKSQEAKKSINTIEWYLNRR